MQGRKTLFMGLVETNYCCLVPKLMWIVYKVKVFTEKAL